MEKGKEEKRRKKSILISVGNVVFFCFSWHKVRKSQRVTVSSRRELNMKLTITQVLDGHHSITPDSSLKKYHYSHFTHKENEA